MKSHENSYRKGLWTPEEDGVLIDYITVHGKGKWNRIAKETGLKRCGKSCRLRWMNYLCPAIKRGDFSEEEEDLIIRLHKLLGNRWSLIAGRVPGRTDNQVKNHWNTHLSKKLGIKKKEKSKEMTVNNSQLSRNEQDKDYCIPSEHTLSEQPNTSDQNGIVDNNVAGDHIGSFWFSNADYDFMINPKYSSYDVLEPLEEHSLDFVWDFGL